MDPQNISTWFGIIGGIIGAVTGITSMAISLRTSRRQEQLRLDEDNDFAFLASLMQTQLRVGSLTGQIISEIEIGEIGSEHWRQCERMLRLGVLERGPKGRGYKIKGFEDLKALPFKRQAEKKAEEIDIDRNVSQP